jgi:hypothetical protein
VDFINFVAAILIASDFSRQHHQSSATFSGQALLVKP